ncbi:MAG: GC-type dockerin domain-anchored protein [Planctomycetota bacterium]|nr:GC-type dockerin domain-anchored protein [Planctomycetota bacterium]
MESRFTPALAMGTVLAASAMIAPTAFAQALSRSQARSTSATAFAQAPGLPPSQQIDADAAFDFNSYFGDSQANATAFGVAVNAAGRQESSFLPTVLTAVGRATVNVTGPIITRGTGAASSRLAYTFVLPRSTAVTLIGSLSFEGVPTEGRFALSGPGGTVLSVDYFTGGPGGNKPLSLSTTLPAGTYSISMNAVIDSTSVSAEAEYLFNLVLSSPAIVIDWFTVDGGGVTQITGGGLTLGGTIGQHDASALNGSPQFGVTGGFWSAFEIFCPADFNRDSQVDFFDYLDFAQAFATEEPSADFNDDGQVDFFDYLDFAAAFDSGC